VSAARLSGPGRAAIRYMYGQRLASDSSVRCLGETRLDICWLQTQGKLDGGCGGGPETLGEHNDAW
jgi:hypothetical protein